MRDKNTSRAEKLKYTLLAVVGVIVLSGSLVLFYQIEKQDSSSLKSNSNEEIKNEIADLNKKIDELNQELKEAKNQSPVVETQTYTSSSVKKSSQFSQGQVAGDSTEVSGRININTASVGQLDSLPGIGPTYAQRIIDYRSANGGFKSMEEIKNVKGIGDKTYEKFKDQITI